MKPSWLIGILAGCSAWAQTPAPTPVEILNSIQTELRGQGDRDEALTNGALALPAPARPTGQTVSVARLRHKAPRAAQASYQKARKDSRAGRYQHAAAELEAALQRDPEFAEAQTLLGVEYTRLERNADAEVVLRRALDLDPNSATAHYYLGIIRFRTGDVNGAEQSARIAVRQTPESAWPHFFLGFLLYPREESRPEALQHLQYAARTLPQARSFLQDLRTTGP